MIIRLGTRQVPALALLAVLCALVCGLGPQQVLGGTELVYHLR